MSSHKVDIGHLKPKTYVMIWAILLILLFSSLGVGYLKSQMLAVVLIFGIAIIKAVIVAFYFMHLKVEVLYLKCAVLSGIFAALTLFIGVYPDAVAFFSK